FRITRMVRVLRVSGSGYYDWCKRRDRPSARTLHRIELDARVKQAFAAARERNGAIRLSQDCAEQGYKRNRKTIGKSLNRQGLCAKAAKKFKATTNSRHDLPVAPNLLQQDFTATVPNQKWVGDITYLWTNEGWLYL